MVSKYTFFDSLNIVLASSSPRRQQLLQEANLNFSIINIELNEEYPSNLIAEEIPIYLSKLKSKAIDISTFPANTVIITADTIVCLNNKEIGKPKNKEQAQIILKSLSNNVHNVITAITLKSKLKEISFSVTTKVYFKEISNTEIDYYLDNYQPFDKAGAYGIQDWIGKTCISRIEGSYDNIMGLPVFEVYKALKLFL